MATESTKVKSDFVLFFERTRTEMQALFLEKFQEFFDQNPRVQRIAWEQYTPVFNDGDRCEFSVGDMKFLLEGKTEEIDAWEFRNSNPALYSFSRNSRDLCGLFYWLFGDNQRVMVTRTEITSEGYNCGF